MATTSAEAATTTAAVTVHYNFVIEKADRPSSVTHRFPLTDPTPTTSAAYYADLSRAVKSATAVVGEDLTAWRDAVGNDEKVRESSIPAAHAHSSDEGEEGEEDIPH